MHIDVIAVLSCQQLLSVPRPPTQNKRSPTPPNTSSSSPNLISMTTTTTTSSPGQPVVDLITGMGSSSSGAPEASPWQSSLQQPSLGDDPQKAVKDNIMSLYSSQGQSSSGLGHPQVMLFNKKVLAIFMNGVGFCMHTLGVTKLFTNGVAAQIFLNFCDHIMSYRCMSL